MDDRSELTQYQISVRQDFVDYAIFSMLRQVLRDCDIDPEWDIEIIGDIRDRIDEFYFEKDSEASSKFYP